MTRFITKHQLNVGTARNTIQTIHQRCGGKSVKVLMNTSARNTIQMSNVVSKANSAEFLPGDRHYIPVELREENYNKIRDTIFNKQVQNQYLIEL